MCINTSYGHPLSPPSLHEEGGQARKTKEKASKSLRVVTVWVGLWCMMWLLVVIVVVIVVVMLNSVVVIVLLLMLLFMMLLGGTDAFW